LSWFRYPSQEDNVKVKVAVLYLFFSPWGMLMFCPNRRFPAQIPRGPFSKRHPELCVRP
jgi:hypothetical protein